MPHINIIRPPKVSVDARKSFWKQIGMIVVDPDSLTSMRAFDVELDSLIGR